MSVRRTRVNGKQTASPSTSLYRTAPVPPAPAAAGPDGTPLVSASHQVPLETGSPSATMNDLLPGSSRMGMRSENQSDQSVTNTTGASAVTGVVAPISAGSARGKGREASSVREILRRKEEEVKQMLAPEKDMSGERVGGKESVHIMPTPNILSHDYYQVLSDVESARH